MIPLSYNMRSLFVRKATTLATAMGIALVVFIFASVLMLQNGIKKTLGITGRPDNAVVLSKGSEAEIMSNIEQNKIALVAAKEGVAKGEGGAPLVMAELVVVVTVPKLGTSGVTNVTVRGVQPNALTMRPEVKLVAGRLPSAGDEVIVGKAIRGRFEGVDLEQKVTLRKGRDMKVVGIFSAEGSSYESEIWGDFEKMREVFIRPALASSIRVRLTSADAYPAFEAAVESDPSVQYEVMRETEYYEKQSEGLAMFITALGITIAVFFSLGAMIGAMITMYSSVSNRQREIGTLRALGFSRLGILFSFLLESMTLAIGGGAIGALAAMMMGFVKISLVNFASWSEIVFTFSPTTDVVVSSLIFGSVMGLIGGFFPALRAARMSPIQAMRA